MIEGPALDELLGQDPNALRRKCGIAHPLWHFGIAGKFQDNFFADVILEFLHDTVWEEPHSVKWKGAVYFLVESEKAYPYACAGAGIDARKLRNHLRRKIGGLE